MYILFNLAQLEDLMSR